MNETDGADAAGRERGVRPVFQCGPDARALADQAIDIGLLACRRLPLSGAWRKHALGNARVDRDERIAVEDAHQMRIPAHADLLAEQREWHGIERATDFDVAVGVDGPLPAAKERKAFGGKGL